MFCCESACCSITTALSSFSTRPFAHRSGEVLVPKWIWCCCWSYRIWWEIIPSINCCHPILSWSLAIRRYSLPRPWQISVIVQPQQLCAYSAIQYKRYGLVSNLSSQSSIRSKVCHSISTLPWCAQKRTWTQVSHSIVQLGNFLTLLLSYSLVPAIPITYMPIVGKI